MKAIGNINRNIASVLHRFHLVMFVVVVAIGLAVGILLLYELALTTTDPVTNSDEGTKPSFDKATIDQIKQLKTSSEPSTSLDFSSRRTSPFSE